MKIRITSLLLLLSLSFHGFSQEYEMISQPHESNLVNLFGHIKHVLPTSIDFEYNIHSNDLQPDFESMKDYTRYDSAFYLKYLNLSKSDPKNPFHYNSIAICYKENSQRDSSQIYFYKAMQNMSMDYFKDSASYYSYMSVIKQNLGMNGNHELKRAIELNPIDSLAIGLYPIYLINQNKFEEAEKVCVRALKKEYQQSPLLMLGMNEIFSQLQKYDVENDSVCKVVRETNLTDIIDFKMVSKYAKKSKTKEAKNMVRLLETLAFAFKIGFSEKDENFNPILKFTKEDHLLIDDLVSWNYKSLREKTLNEFTANKNLAFLYLLKNQHDSTMVYSKKAINIFPLMKNDDRFNGNDIFSILEISLRMQQDFATLKGVINSDVEAKTMLGNSTFLGNLNLATLFMYDMDYKMCAEHAIRAKNIKEDHVDLARLIMHYHKIMGNQKDFDDYFKATPKMVEEEKDAYYLFLQFGMYALFQNNADDVVKAFDQARNFNKGTCEICDELQEKYIKKK